MAIEEDTHSGEQLNRKDPDIYINDKVGWFGHAGTRRRAVSLRMQCLSRNWSFRFRITRSERTRIRSTCDVTDYPTTSNARRDSNIPYVGVCTYVLSSYRVFRLCDANDVKPGRLNVLWIVVGKGTVVEGIPLERNAPLTQKSSLI